MPGLPPKPIKTDSLGMGARCQHFFISSLGIPMDRPGFEHLELTGGRETKLEVAELGGWLFLTCVPQKSATGLKANVNK